MSYRVIEISDRLEVHLNRWERQGYRLVGRTDSAVIMHRQHLRPWVAEMLREAVGTDGAHHKQWYLEQVAEGLEVALPDHEKGIAP